MGAGMGKLAVIVAALIVAHDPAALGELAERLGGDAALLAAIGDDAATIGDDTKMAQDTREAYRDHIAGLEVIWRVHR